MLQSLGRLPLPYEDTRTWIALRDALRELDRRGAVQLAAGEGLVLAHHLGQLGGAELSAGDQLLQLERDAGLGRDVDGVLGDQFLDQRFEVVGTMHELGAGIQFLKTAEAKAFLARQDATYRGIIEDLGLRIVPPR